MEGGAIVSGLARCREITTSVTNERTNQPTNKQTNKRLNTIPGGGGGNNESVLRPLLHDNMGDSVQLIH